MSGREKGRKGEKMEKEKKKEKEGKRKDLHARTHGPRPIASLFFCL